MTDIFNTAAVKASGLDADHPRAAVLSMRDDIMTMTQQAHDAVLGPKKTRRIVPWRTRGAVLPHGAIERGTAVGRNFLKP